MKPAVNNKSVLSVDGLLLLRVSTILPNSNGGASDIIFSANIVVHVEISSTVYFLQVALIMVCMGCLKSKWVSRLA
ncbi:hypothetical protein D3C80_1603270 [compost metagenome]